MKREYPFLKQQSFQDGDFELLPIRMEDRMDIMKWRNEQIYHLRQAKPLTKEHQDNYFEHIVSKLFETDRPVQVLFSLLRNGRCIGYGGLVHINWIDRNAEISFIMDTALEKEEFESIWSAYLGLIEQVAFQEMDLHKLYVYAFDLRPHLYTMLVNNAYFLDARLKDHCYFQGVYKDVVIHSKLRKA